MRKTKPDGTITMLKISAIGLLLVFVFSFASPFLTFKARQYQVRKEIKHRIKNGVPEKELTCFSLSDVLNDKSFGWEKEGKEFNFKGKLYDIVRKELCQGKSVLKCIDDTQEKCLFTDLENMVTQTQSKDKNQISYSLFFPLYESQQIYILSLTVDSTDMTYSIKETLIKPGHTSIVVPPPNINS